MNQILLEVDNSSDLALLLSLADRLKARVISIKNKAIHNLSYLA